MIWQVRGSGTVGVSNRVGSSGETQVEMTDVKQASKIAKLGVICCLLRMACFGNPP